MVWGLIHIEVMVSGQGIHIYTTHIHRHIHKIYQVSQLFIWPKNMHTVRTHIQLKIYDLGFKAVTLEMSDKII